MPESNQADRSPEDIVKYARSPESEIVYRWRKDWWDGPLNGSISYHGNRYRFSLYCESTEPANSSWYYLVFRLSEEEADLADTWRRDLDSLAARWTSLNNNPETKTSPAIKEIADRIEAHHKLLPDYSARTPLAWFTSGSNSSFYPVQVVKDDRDA